MIHCPLVASDSSEYQEQSSSLAIHNAAALFLRYAHQAAIARRVVAIDLSTPEGFDEIGAEGLRELTKLPVTDTLNKLEVLARRGATVKLSGRLTCIRSQFGYIDQHYRLDKPRMRLIFSEHCEWNSSIHFWPLLWYRWERLSLYRQQWTIWVLTEDALILPANEPDSSIIPGKVNRR